jgi:hypothetical protein
MKVLGAVFLLAVWSMPACAADDGELKELFDYGWSRSAELIVYATVVSLQRQDSADMAAPHLDAVLRIDRVQRGLPGGATLTVTIEDLALAKDPDGDALAIGTHGLWFVNGVVRSVDAEPRGRLLRVLTSAEIALKPEYAEALLRHALNDTIEMSIPRETLRALVPPTESARVTVTVAYDDQGRLADATLADRSGNAVLDGLVFDAVVYAHRDLAFPPVLRSARITVAQAAQEADTRLTRERIRTTRRQRPGG